MGLKNTVNWLFAMVLTSFFCVSANAEVIFQDNFDADVEPVAIGPWPARGEPDPALDWMMVYNDLTRSQTSVSTGGGELLIQTEDRASGVISHAREEFDFFDRELTYTFGGVSIDALGRSQLGAQWVQFGVVAYSGRSGWSAASSFIIAYNGLGSFEFRVRQPVRNASDDTEPRKLFKSTAFNFDISFLREIQLTLDSVNYRVAFVFENDLDRFQFGGPHNLNRDVWLNDTVDAGYAGSQMTRAERNVALYEGLLAAAQAANDPVGIAREQERVDFWEAQRVYWTPIFAERTLLLDELKGNSAVVIAVTSDASFLINEIGRDAASDENGDVGARVTIDSMTVETTSILEGL